MSLIKVKDILVKPIDSRSANRIVKKLHYSGKVCQNSKIHFGCFVDDKCLGVMSFGSSMDKRRMANTVKGSKITEFLELNRMAFDDRLPHNSESRCLGISLRILKKEYPFIKWIVTFADGCQCGDGTIYRATGFDLIGIKKNTTLLKKGNVVVADKTLNDKIDSKGKRGTKVYKDIGFKPLKGYQIKYIKFLHESEKENLTVPILDYSEIEKIGAKMYKGKRIKHSSDAAINQMDKGGAIPTDALQ